MAVEGEEIRPRSFTQDQAVRVYHVTDAPTEDDVAAFIETLPDTVAGLPYSSFEAGEIEDCENSDEWLVSVTWGTPDRPQAENEPGSSSYKFSFQAPSGHIKRSLATIAEYEDTAYFPLGAPPMQGAINVVDYGTADVHAEGFDLQPPPEVFSIPYTDVDVEIDAAYQALVRSLCGKVNSATFYGYAAGEIMLVRADGQRSGGLWNLEFGFGYIPNATSIPVGDNITVTSKDGMDLLWALDATANDTVSKSLITQPVCAYVERVWYRADLTTLNLPGIP